VLNHLGVAACSVGEVDLAVLRSEEDGLHLKEGPTDYLDCVLGYCGYGVVSGGAGTEAVLGDVPLIGDSGACSSGANFGRYLRISQV